MKRLHIFYEIPFFYFLLFALERSFFPDHPSFYEIEPHPYWLGIVIFGLRYGLLSGLMSGMFSACFYLGGLWVHMEPYLFEDPEFYILPGLFVLIGLAMGGWSDRFLFKLKIKEEVNEDLLQKNQAMQKEIALQQQVNQTLEKQIVSEMASLATLYQGARRLGSLDRQKLMEGICDFFSQALSATQAALYVNENNRWVLRASKGWSSENEYQKELKFAEGVIGKAGSENRIVTIREWFGPNLEKVWEGKEKVDAILAGPIRRGPQEVIGVFGVQKMPFLKFNSASANLLALLLDWAESAVAQSFFVEELKSKSILDELYEVYSDSYFQSRTSQEFSRSKTYSLPFSILLISLKGIESIAPTHQIHFLRALSRILLKVARPIDVVTKLSDVQVPFAVLMITASHDQAQEMKKKLIQTYLELELDQAAIGDKGATIQLQVGVGSFSPKMSSAQEILEQARNDF